MRGQVVQGDGFKVNGQDKVLAEYTETIQKSDTIIIKNGNMNLELLPDAADSPKGLPQKIRFSNGSNYLAIGDLYAPRLKVYKRDGDVFTKLTNPPQPAYLVSALAFSSTDTYLAVPTPNSPTLLILKRSGDTFTKLADPSVLPTAGYGGDFSPDDVHLAICSSTTPYLTIYKRSGDTFTKLADPSSQPTGFSRACAFSNDGLHLAVIHDNSPYLTIYKRSGDTFTKLADPSVLPTGSQGSISFSDDGKYLCIGHQNSPFFTIYKRSGDTFVKLANPSVLPANNVRVCQFSKNTIDLAIAIGAPAGTRVFELYAVDNYTDTFTKIEEDASFGTSISSLDISKDDGILVIGGSASDARLFWPHKISRNLQVSKSNNDLDSFGGAVGVGVAASGGIKGDIKEVLRIWR